MEIIKLIRTWMNAELLSPRLSLIGGVENSALISLRWRWAVSNNDSYFHERKFILLYATKVITLRPFKRPDGAGVL